MKKLMRYLIGFGILVTLLVACTPFPAANEQRYQLMLAGKVKHKTAHQHLSILVMQPDALPGYDTEQMLYVNKPYQISAFANNVWMSPPATMIFPLMVRSIGSSHYFYAVASDPNVSKTDYRLESKLIRLQQNFLTKPSQLELMMQVILIHSADNRVVATETISERMPCPSNNPLGGVIAANHAVQKLTTRLTYFVIEHINHDQ